MIIVSSTMLLLLPTVLLICLLVSFYHLFSGKEDYIPTKGYIPPVGLQLLMAWTSLQSNGLIMLQMSSVFLERQPLLNTDNRHLLATQLAVRKARLL